ncbi:hypothetical protein BJ912DRAFT_1042501 [Pholiota molesta]|nr:hypothetical protein BJ912DRAFT_1042501 [Pholiota molesta]
MQFERISGQPCLENRRDNVLKSIRRTPQSPHSIRRNSNIGNQNARTRAPAFQTPASHVADLDHRRAIELRPLRPPRNTSGNGDHQQMALQASTKAKTANMGGGTCRMGESEHAIGAGRMAHRRGSSAEARPTPNIDRLFCWRYHPERGARGETSPNNPRNDHLDVRKKKVKNERHLRRKPNPATPKDEPGRPISLQTLPPCALNELSMASSSARPGGLHVSRRLSASLSAIDDMDHTLAESVHIMSANGNLPPPHWFAHGGAEGGTAGTD